MLSERSSRPWSPLSDVRPRVFPAQPERGEAPDNSPHLTRAHNTHPPDMSNDRSTGSRSKNLGAPGYFGYYYPHTDCTLAPATLTPDQNWGLRAHGAICVSVSELKVALSNLSNYPKWLSREASECLSAPLCDKTLFVCLCLRESFIKSRSWLNRILETERLRQNWSGRDPCNWTLLETEFREWMPVHGLLMLRYTHRTAHITLCSSLGVFVLFTHKINLRMTTSTADS